MSAFPAALAAPAELGYPRTGLAVFIVLAIVLSIFRRRLSLAVFWIAFVGGTLGAISLSSQMEQGERITVLLVLAVLVGVALYQQQRPILQYLFFCRFSLTIGLLLLFLPFLGLGPLRSLFRNLFVTSAIGVFLISLLAFLVAWVVLLTARIAAGGAQERFCVTWHPKDSPPRPSPRRSFLQLALSGLLALPTVGAVVVLSPESGSPRESTPAGIGFPLLLALLGLVSALFLFYAAYLLGRYLAPPGSAASEWDLLPLPLPRALVKRMSGARVSWALRPWERLEQRIASQKEDLRAGYLTEGHLRPGLGLATSFAAVTFAFYGVCYFLLHPDGFRVEPPALANVLFLLILLGWILPCLSFFLDRFRVPLLAFLASLTFLLYFISDIDHYYQLNEPSAKEAAAGRGTTTEPHAIIPETQVESKVGKEVEYFLSERQKIWARDHSDRKPVLVAVAASGGGITASLWTAKVLAELQRELGPDFSESIYGLSTVSGGSVGAMYFIDAFVDGRAPTEKSLGQVIEKAGTSSLAATAWGLAYPDFWRAFSLQNPFRPFFDRAWAMEQVWRRTLRPGGTDVPTLATWRADVRAGLRPAALFNATVAETGERLVLSPLKLNPLPGGCVADDPGFDDCVDARTFTQLYNDKDLPVTTAARLSATFPFVSPITRARLANSAEVSNPYHVADGGYYDNYGVVTLVEGLRRVLNIYGKKSGLESSSLPAVPEPAAAGALPPPRKILVIEIRASDSKEAKEAKRRAGWAFGTAGPVMTLLNVWGSGQTPRNDLDLQLLKEVAKSRGFEVETVLFPLVSDAPLSWDLTESQKQGIERGWDWCAAMPARQGQKSKIQLGIEKVRAFLTQNVGWKDLPQTRFSTPPSGVSPEDMQDFCLGKTACLTAGTRRPAGRFIARSGGLLPRSICSMSDLF